MKKILYLALGLMMSTVTFTACSDEIGDDSQAYSQTPAADVAGTYTGTWTAVCSDPTVATETFDGTLIIAKSSDSNYVIEVKASNPGLSVEKSGKANISSESNGYSFVNNQTGAANTFGVSFYGKVTGANASLTYTGSRKVGRKTIGFTYTFNGSK